MIDFVAPVTGERLRHEDGKLRSESGEEFRVVNGIPRFVDSEDYAANFGLEWLIHAQTQLDSRTGTSISRDRLERCLNAPLESLQGKTVLEAGCGAGRFTELLVDAGALVHAIDMSRAVEANRRNISDHHTNYVVAQADLLKPPFPPGSFDVVVCLGVLQHTPSPENSIAALWRMVRPGGQLIIDHYTWSLARVTKTDVLLRSILKRRSPQAAKVTTDNLVRALFPLHWRVRHVRPLQMALSRVSPVSVYFSKLPQLSEQDHYEWSRLDTFDGLTDRYKRMRTAGQITRHLRSLGAEEVDVWRGGNGIEARGRKPLAHRG